MDGIREYDFKQFRETMMGWDVSIKSYYSNNLIIIWSGKNLRDYY